MKKLKIAFVVLLICLTAAVFGEETETKPEMYDNAIGFVYTPSSPIGNFRDELVAGIQYQHWFDKVGFSLTGSMYYDQNYDFGEWDETSQQYVYDYHEKLDWKVLAGTQFILCSYDIGKLNWSMYYWLDGGVGARQVEPDEGSRFYLFAGTGIGCETVFWRHISVPLEIGYHGQFLNDGGFGICASTGIRFRF